MGTFGSKTAVIKMTRHPAQDEHYSKEEDILLDLSHPNVVRVYGSELERASGALKPARQPAHLSMLSTTSQRVAENGFSEQIRTKCALSRVLSHSVY